MSDTKTTVTENGKIIDEWDHIVWNVPRVGDWLKFPTNNGHISKKVSEIIWGMKEDDTLEIRV